MPFKEYLDKNENPINSEQGAEFYREGIRNDKGQIEGELKTYSMNGTLKRILEYENGSATGLYTDYYINGKLETRVTQNADNLTRKQESWYQNGQKKEDSIWNLNLGKVQYTLISFWDSTGRQTITNGTGDLITYNPDQTIDYTETYQKGILIQGKSYDETGKEYIYDGPNSEQMPEFPGGINALSQYLSANLKYPKEARKNRISGKVSVSFMVGRDGMVKDVQVFDRKLGYGIEEAIRVVSEMPNWQPGLQYGRPVRYRMPITFSL